MAPIIHSFQAMDRHELNGPGFFYRVGYRRVGGSDRRGTVVTIPDWTRNELVIGGQEPHREYIIFVEAVNDEGTAPRNFLDFKIGYSGQEGERAVYILLIIFVIYNNFPKSRSNYDCNATTTSSTPIPGFCEGPILSQPFTLFSSNL